MNSDCVGIRGGALCKVESGFALFVLVVVFQIVGYVDDVIFLYFCCWDRGEGFFAGAIIFVNGVDVVLGNNRDGLVSVMGAKNRRRIIGDGGFVLRF